MTNDEWETIALLLDKGFKWREPFGEAQAQAYRLLLDGCTAEQLGEVIRRMVARGQVFGPTPGEIVAAIRDDPDRPTFDEAYRQIFGPGGVLGFKRAGVQVSPWVEAFVGWYGIDRLRPLEVDHPEYGDLKRRELGRSYEQFLEVSEGRDVAQIASGRRGGIGRLDPFTALGVRQPARIGDGS